MNNSRWIYKESNGVLGVDGDSDILNILSNRGIVGEEDTRAFIESTIEDLHSPFLLEDMERSIEKIIESKDKNIWIYGDYDVDGITSTSLCYLTLKELGYNVNYYIPLRDEGYGLNKDALTHIKDMGGNLVITVDCGVSSIEEIDHGNEIGLETIITDHHNINSSLPSAYGVINPKRVENKYPYDNLAGVGTAFMLMYGLCIREERKEVIFKHLDIVAIGTVADIVPLVGDNRILVKEGLERLKATENVGIRELLKIVYEGKEKEEYNTYDIGFIIAPIFNAAGRLEDAKRGVELMVTDSMVDGRTIAKELIAQNIERKEIQEDILGKVEDEVEEKKLYNEGAIVVASKDFHHGVIGIVASKIVDKYYKPTVILEIKEDEGIAVASCRSIEGYSVVEGLNDMKELFIRYGGHSGAAGLSIEVSKIEEFKGRLSDHVLKTLDKESFLKPVKIEKSIHPSKVAYYFIERLKKLEPYGFGNPSPVFSMIGCKYKKLRLIGREKNHIMMDIIKDGIEMRNCVWFGNGHNFDEILENQEIDVAFKIKGEKYLGRFQSKIFIEDIKPTSKNKDGIDEKLEITYPIKTLVHSKVKVEEGDKGEITFGQGTTLTIKGRNIGYIDSGTGYLLKEYSERYNHKYEVEVEKVEVEENHYDIYVKIERDHNFKSLATSDPGIFRDIKTFLIGEKDYSISQKKALRDIVADKKDIVLRKELGDEDIEIILKTLGYYWKEMENKVNLITKNSLPKEYYDIFKVSEKKIEGHPLYIKYNVKKNGHSNFDVEVEVSLK